MHSKDYDNPLLLDYAPAPGKAPRFARKALRFVLFAGLAVAGYIWLPAVWDRAKMLYWQRQCLGYAVSADQIVYDAATASGRIPAPPPCWSNFVESAAAVGPALSGMPQYGSLVYLGERKTPSGEPRLVAIAFTSRLNWWAQGRLPPGMSYQVWVVKPGTLSGPPQSIDQLPRSGLTVDDPSLAPDPRFYFGQHDPNDPSRFTIRYRAFGQEDVVDGIIDDAGQVTLTQRKPPTL